MKKTVQTCSSLLAITLLSLAFQIPAFAARSSNTIHVSCSIRPKVSMLRSQNSEASSRLESDNLGLSAEDSNIKVRTNLAGKYKLSKEIRQTSQGPVELYSLAAL